MDEAIGWLRNVIEAAKAEAQALLSEHWGDRPWAVTECSDDEAGNCPCIVYQGQRKPPGEAQVPHIRYIADAETPELAAWIARHDPRNEIARCEAELAILNLYGLWATEAATGSPMMGAAACAVSDAVHHLAGGYRHREGYAAHWETGSDT